MKLIVKRYEYQNLALKFENCQFETIDKASARGIGPRVGEL
jgi:hypothetical protein